MASPDTLKEMDSPASSHERIPSMAGRTGPGKILPEISLLRSGEAGPLPDGLSPLRAGLNKVREMDAHSHADAAAPLIGHIISSIRMRSI